jgi:hypothetical protein
VPAAREETRVDGVPVPKHLAGMSVDGDLISSPDGAVLEQH